VWEQILTAAKQLFSLTRDAKQNKEDIKALRDEDKEARRENAELRQAMNEQQLKFAEMTRFAERVIYELQRTRESAEADKKMLRLEMENSLLRAERRLPPGDSQDKTEIEKLQEQIAALRHEVAELHQRMEQFEKRKK
jgi:hypothetical protein